MGASKTFSLVALLLLTTYLNQAVGESINVTSSQISTTATTNTDSSLESNTCSCDLFSSICDNLCCCDSNCPSDSVSAWKTQGLCTNQEYFYSLSNIPKCSESRPKTIDDLQGGLRIYYQILKILFCIVFDNSSASDLFKGFQSTSDINQAISVAASDTPASATTVYVESPSTGSTFTRVSAYRPSFGSSMCSSQNIILGTNLDSEDCYLTPTTLATFCTSTNTAINPATYSNLSIRKASGSSANATVTVNAFNRNLTSTSTGYSLGTSSLLALIPTEASTSTTSCTCTNYVSEVNYRFVVDSNNLIQSATIDVVVTTTAETFTCSSPVIKQTTSVYFLTAAADYPSLKGPGYRLGDPVLLGLKSGTTFTLFVEPLSFTYMTSAGQCALTTDTADPKYSSTIQFGYLNTFSCSLSFATSTAFSTFCESPETLAMYANVINNIQYIGIYPNSNPAYSLEWYGITAYTAASLGGSQSASTTCVIQAPIISVFYSVIGEQTKPGYKINSATISQAESETFTYTSSSQVFNFKLYVDFIQLDQSSEFFVAPNPTASVSVPDNVLTPFITKKTSTTTTTS